MLTAKKWANAKEKQYENRERERMESRIQLELKSDHT